MITSLYFILENHVLWAWSEFSGYACKYNQGVLENWSIGMKAEDYNVFLFLYLALLQNSIIQLFQKDPEITGITNPLWG